MKPRISVITLAVDDLERAVRFYRDGLGLATDGVIGKEYEFGAVAFFDLASGLKLAVWPRQSISHDTGLPVKPPSPTEFTLGHNVTSRSEVDIVMKQAAEAGASTTFKTPTSTSGKLCGIRNCYRRTKRPHETQISCSCSVA